jgi:hypothetical protein
MLAGVIGGCSFVVAPTAVDALDPGHVQHARVCSVNAPEQDHDGEGQHGGSPAFRQALVTNTSTVTGTNTGTGSDAMPIGRGITGDRELVQPAAWCPDITGMSPNTPLPMRGTAATVSNFD